MHPKNTESLPYGLFRYLYNHYEVRYPRVDRLDYFISGEHQETVRGANPENLAAYLVEHSWLIGIARADLFESVLKLWSDMSPLSRGEYLAAYTERNYCLGPGGEDERLFIRKQLRDPDSIQFSPETACEIGCCLLAFDMEDAFEGLLKMDLPWKQEIFRSSTSDAKRWKTLQKISNRVIDIFLEAALVHRRSDHLELILDHGANPNILFWRLERSSNALYPALGYAISEEDLKSAEVLLDNGADARGSEKAPTRSPISQAFQLRNLPLITRLISAGASFQDGPRYDEAPMFYCMRSPVEWVSENLSELLGLLPLEAKPIFHTPNAQGGFYYTLLQCVWDDKDMLTDLEGLGLALRMTIYEAAQLIERGKFETFCYLAGKLGEDTKKEALARMRKEWPEFGE